MNIPKQLYYAVMLLSLFLLLIRWKKLDSRLHIYVFVLSAAFLAEKINDIFYPSNAGKYAAHVYQVIELCCISFYYYSMFRSAKNRGIVLTGVAAFFVFIFFTFICRPENILADKKFDLVVCGFIITVYSVLYLIELYQQDQPVILQTYPHFWIVTSNLMFYSITLAFYTFQQYLWKHSHYYEQLCIIPEVFNIILYSFYSIGFTCQQTKKLS